MFLLLEFTYTMGEGAIVSKFTFAKVYHIFAHLCFLLFLDIGVELLPFLVIGKCLLDFFPGGLTVCLRPSRRVVTVGLVRAVVGRVGIMSAMVLFFNLRNRYKRLEFLVMFFVVFKSRDDLLSLAVLA